MPLYSLCLYVCVCMCVLVFSAHVEFLCNLTGRGDPEEHKHPPGSSYASLTSGRWGRRLGGKGGGVGVYVCVCLCWCVLKGKKHRNKSKEKVQNTSSLCKI